MSLDPFVNLPITLTESELRKKNEFEHQLDDQLSDKEFLVFDRVVREWQGRNPQYVRWFRSLKISLAIGVCLPVVGMCVFSRSFDWIGITIFMTLSMIALLQVWTLSRNEPRPNFRDLFMQVRGVPRAH
jgi:hypothetical protein